MCSFFFVYIAGLARVLLGPTLYVYFLVLCLFLFPRLFGGLFLFERNSTRAHQDTHTNTETHTHAHTHTQTSRTRQLQNINNTQVGTILLDKEKKKNLAHATPPKISTTAESEQYC